MVDCDAGNCERHASRSLKYFCEDCQANICDICAEQTECSSHRRTPLAAVAERFRQGLDSSFTAANTQISRKKTELEGKLRALADEKDRALLKIECAFDTYSHTLARRATLLKNKVIDIYNENAASLETGLEEIETAMTCVVSLRDFYENAISRSDFASFGPDGGSGEIDEVALNVIDHISAPEVHLMFDSEHGVPKFKACTQDLGRVACTRSHPNIPNTDTVDGRAVLASCSSEALEPSPDSPSPSSQNRHDVLMVLPVVILLSMLRVARGLST